MNAASPSRRGAGAWARRGDAALRLLAAGPIGYAVASLWAMALARALPMGHAAASVTAVMVAFAFIAAAMMWAYAARSGARAVALLLLAAAPAAAGVWLSIRATGRL